MPGKHKMTTCICRNCGKPFEIPTYRFKREKNPGQWCSMECRNSKGGWHPGLGKGIQLPAQQITQEYLDGASLRTIAARHDTSPNVVLAALKQLGIERRKPQGTRAHSPETQRKTRESARRRWTENNPRKRRDLPDEEICQAYQDGASAAMIAARFKCDVSAILERVRKAGIPVRPQGYTTNVTCSDGHIANSQWEAQIDEWLTAHDIPHEIHPRTPWYTPANRSFGDFLIGNTYVELWGIQKSARYDARRMAKIELYHKHNAELIEIYPYHIISGDFSPLEDLLYRPPPRVIRTIVPPPAAPAVPPVPTWSRTY